MQGIDRALMDSLLTAARASPRRFHTLAALDEGVVVFETKAGPRMPHAPGEKAPFAPGKAAQAAAAYLENLRRLFSLR